LSNVYHDFDDQMIKGRSIGCESGGHDANGDVDVDWQSGCDDDVIDDKVD
jgi:hypothetical protein